MEALEPVKGDGAVQARLLASLQVRGWGQEGGGGRGRGGARRACMLARDASRPPNPTTPVFTPLPSLTGPLRRWWGSWAPSAAPWRRACAPRRARPRARR